MKLDIKLDFDNIEKPLFMQLAEQLEDNILKGVFPEETQIPSSTEISVTFSINPATSNKGVNLLVDEGIIYKKRGIGMFVADGATEKIRKKRSSEFYSKYVSGLIAEAQKLGINEDELISLIKKAYKEGF